MVDSSLWGLRVSAIGVGRPAEIVYLGLGTNMGDRLEYLRRALFALAMHPELQVRGASRVYETEYVGVGSQDPYLNACVEVATRLRPQVLLAILKSIEEREGRQSGGHMLPRPIDLDILLFGDRILAQENLQVPHKGMRERAFVLVPLAELAADKEFPDSGETIGSACAKIRRKPGPWVRALTETGLVSAEAETRLRLDLNKEDWRAALGVHCR